ncbi:DUF6924 domain-containing protein [Deinococcus koreensis]|uniref:DUF6924 domain-containing protein n=1 Tax=Deinococcus koreensis TaxID=2054903 RepID=UPI0010573550|nr:hypothetical protein [Deinococcus koreensis]
MPFTLPEPDDLTSLLVRTDYSDNDSWQTALAAATAPVQLAEMPTPFVARFTIVEHADYDGLSIAALSAALHDSALNELFVVDKVSTTEEEHTLLVVHVDEADGGAIHSFRVSPEYAWAVQNNLCLANMDFQEFAVNVDRDGVYRGGSTPTSSDGA